MRVEKTIRWDGEEVAGSTSITPDKCKKWKRKREFSIAIFLVFILMLVKSCLNCTWRDCATSHAHFVLGKKVSLMWLRCGHFDNRPGASLESNHVVAMMQCSHVDHAWCRQSVNQQENIVCWKISCCRKVGKENSATNWFLQVHATSTNVTHRQQDSRKKQMLSPNLTTDGAGRTKVPTKTGRFWAWVSAHQETVWKVEDCLQ